MHFAAWLAVGESVRHPGKYYENNVTGSLLLLEAMAAEGVRQLVFSSTCAVYGEPDRLPLTETHPHRAGQRLRRVEAGRRAGAAGTSASRTGCGSIALRYFNAAGADPDGELGEDHAPEIHLIPLAIDAARGGRPLEVFGLDYPTPDGTCLRDYVHVMDLAAAHVLALAALEAGHRQCGLQRGHRPAVVGARGDRHGVARGRDAGRVAGGAAPRRRSLGALRLERAVQAELGWQPVQRSRDHRGACCRLARRAPRRLRGRPRRADGSPAAPAPLRSTAPAGHRRRVRRHARSTAPRRRRSPGWSSRSSTRCCRPASRWLFVGTAIVVAYVAKGIGAFFSSYWMDDLGHRVVRSLRTDLFEHVLGQSAAFFARRIDRPTAVAGQQRRRPGAAGRVGDRRRHRPRDRSPSSAMPRCSSTSTPGWRWSA